MNLGVCEGLSRVSWKLSSTVLRGGANGNVGSLLDQRAGKTKQPFHFGMQDDSLFAFAGLWDTWTDPSGRSIESCSILTTVANAIMGEVHHRMPVILGRDDYSTWLDPALGNTARLTALLKPFEPASMKRFAVSPRVNLVANDDVECAEPWSPPQATLALEF